MCGTSSSNTITNEDPITMESLLTCINALQINSSKTTQSITELNETLIKYTQVTLTQVEETQNAMKILKSIDNHLHEKELRAIYNDAAAKFKGRIKQDQGIESFLHFWKDLKFLLFFHNKHHLVDYLSEKESDELTEAEKVLLEQIILSAVDDRLEMKLRLDCRLQRDKKEDDYALKLFRIVRRKAIGAKSWEGYFYHYVPSIVPTHGEDASDTYICRINEVKQLQKWNNNHGERLVACLLYESQPSDFRHYFENYWEKLHPVKGFRTEEELAHDIREDLETVDIYMKYISIPFFSFNAFPYMDTSQSDSRELQIDHPITKNKNKNKGSRNTKGRNRKHKSHKNKDNSATTKDT